MKSFVPESRFEEFQNNLPLSDYLVSSRDSCDNEQINFGKG